MYLPGFSRLYFFGDLQLENVACLCFLLTSAHWNPVEAPVAPHLKLAVPELESIVEWAIVVFGGDGGGRDTRLNVAATLCAALIVNVHDPAPVQAPLQPAKVEPEAAVAIE